MKFKILLCLLSILEVNYISRAQNFSWAKQISGSDYETVNAMAVDQNGNVYTAGSFPGTTDFDPGVGSYNLTAISTDIFVSKLNSSGDFIWAKKMGGLNSSAQCNSIAVDDYGNIYLTGSFSQTVDFDPDSGTYNLTSATNNDIFIEKLDSSGNIIWARNISGPTFGSFDEGNSITIDKNGNSYISGNFSGSADFDPDTSNFNLTAFGNDDNFILKLNASGDFVFAKQLGGINLDWNYSIALDTFGNIFTTGFFTNSADLDPGVNTFNVSGNGEEAFISKLDSSGNFIWARKFSGANGDEYGKSITLDKLGNVYSTGYYSDSTDFDPGTGVYYLTAEYYDIYISKLDSGGNFIWAKRIGGPDYDEPTKILLDAGNNVYITGSYVDSADFDPGSGVYYLSNISHANCFVTKLDNSGNLIWAKQMSGIGESYGTSIGLDASENIYLTGNFSNNIDCDPGNGVVTFNTSGDNDVFIVKLLSLSTNVENNIDDKNVYNIYPNPSSGKFNISGTENFNDVRVRNILGEIIYHSRELQKSLSFQLEKSGIYFVEITTEKGILSKKIIVTQ